MLILFGAILFETLYASWTVLSASIPRLGKVLIIISSNKLSAFSSLFSFWNPNNANVSVLDVVPKIS